MARTPKTVAQGRVNLEASIVLIPERYRQGIAGADWKGPAGSDVAETRFSQEMQAALAGKRRQLGISRVSNEEWKMKADKGADSIGQGIRNNLDKWEREFGRVYNQVLPVLRTLPPKGPDFRANITGRLIPVVEAFKRGAGRLGGGPGTGGR